MWRNNVYVRVMFGFHKTLVKTVIFGSFFFALLNFPITVNAFEPFGTVTVVADFAVNGDGTNIDTIAFWEAPDYNNSLMFVTSKNSSLVEVWKYPFNSTVHQLSPITHSCIDNGSNGVIVDQETDKLYVSNRYSSNVCVFNLPNLSFDKVIKHNTLFRSEPNLALMKLPNNEKRLYVSDDYQVFIYNPLSSSLLNTFRPSKGLEAMYADNYSQTLYIPDEGGRSGIYAYDSNGSPVYKNNKNYFGGGGIFDSDAEGIFVYKCSEENDDGNGLIVVSDQISTSSIGNDYEVFDRNTWEYLGKFKVKLQSGTYVYNTDGIAITQQRSSLYPLGLFTAIQSDTSTVGVSWQKILNATKLSCSNVPQPTNNPTSTPKPTVAPTSTPHTPSPTPSSTPSGNTQSNVILTPLQDATVKESYVERNYGSAASLIASDYYSSNTNLAYLQFDLSSLAGSQLKNVELKIEPSLSRKVGKIVKLVKEPWSEQTITWSNKPPLDVQVGQFNAEVTSGNEITIVLDSNTIQSYVGQTLSIAIDNTATQNTLEFSSREGTSPPALVITTQGELSSNIKGDVNKDGVVDLTDYEQMIGLYGSNSQNADFNNNGVVDILDYNVILSALTVLPTASPIPTSTPISTITPKPTSSPVPTTTPRPTVSPIPTPTPPGLVYRAFTVDSYWNTAMPNNAPIDPNNSKYIAYAKDPTVSAPYLRLAGAPDHSAAWDWSYPIYWAKASDPMYTISPSSYGQTIKARIPLGAIPMGGSDGALIVYDLSSNQVIELWQASYNSSNDTWSAASTKRYLLDSNGLDSSVTGSNTSQNFGHRGIPPSSRAIRLDEVASGRVEHRLECFWHSTYEKHYWPMSGHESGKGGITPEGLVLRLKPSVDINNKGLSFAEKVIAKAMQEYGCIIGDNEGGINNSLKLERGPDKWKELDSDLSVKAFSVFTWDDYEFIQGGYDPVSGKIIQ